MLHQVGVERQDHERQVGIDDADVHRDVGIEDGQRLADEPQPHQYAVEQAVVGKDAHPGIDPDQDRRPGRHHDQQQQDGLRGLAGAGDGVGHRVAHQQADQGTDEGHLQRAEVGIDVERVIGQHQVVAEVEEHLQLLVRVGEDLGIGRDGHVRFRQADLQHDGEGQQEEQEEPQERHPDDRMPPGGHALFQAVGEFHDCSTTPLSSYQLMYTDWSQVGRATWRSALAMKAWTIIPEASLM